MNLCYHGGPLTEQALYDYINTHRFAVAPGIEKAFNYYLGLMRPHKGRVPMGRPNNYACSNLAKYISDTATGYFCGVPPVYSFSEEAAALRDVINENDEGAEDYELALDMSIAGVAYELVWLGSGGKIHYTSVDPRTAFVLRDESAARTPIAGVRYWSTDEGIVGELYLPGERREFAIKEGHLEFGMAFRLPFTGIALTEYVNNRFRSGDFQPVLENIDQYNLTLSNTTDDLQSIANAFLAITGMMGTTEEDIARMNRDRVVLLAENGGMEFITKDLNADAVVAHLKRLKEDVMQVAGVPDLSDEFFSGNASGVALEYKLWGLNQLFSRKAAGMEKGLFTRWSIIAEIMEFMGSPAIDVDKGMSVRFTRNMPRDFGTCVENAVKLHGVVSERTVYEQLAAVTGVAAEDEMLRGQEESRARGAADAKAAAGADADGREADA